MLDIDGVLNKLAPRPNLHFEKELVERLNSLVKATHAKVVLTSLRRLEFKLDTIEKALRNAGFQYPLYGKTLFYGNNHTRGFEIQKWLERHKVDTSDIVILDDRFDMGVLASRLVHVNPKVGLTSQNAQAAYRLIHKN